MEDVSVRESPWISYLIKVKDGSGKVSSTSPGNNYWAYALEYCVIFYQSVKPVMKYVMLDDYWRGIGEIIDENGILKYQ